MGKKITGQVIRSVLDVDALDASIQALNSKSVDLEEVTVLLEERTKTLADTKAPVIVSTTSGDVATFADGADGMPIKALVTTIEPKQDLHGYDHPWIGGGGKNLLPYPTSVKTTGSTYSSNGVTMTHNDNGTLSFVGTATANSYFYINTYTADHSKDFQYAPGNYILSSEIVGAIAGGYRFQMSVYNNSTLARTYVDTGASVEVTINAGETEAVYLYVPNGKNMDGVVIKPMLRLASETDATFVPYDNICLITGRTDLRGKRTGGNILSITEVYAAGDGTEVTKDAQTGTAIITNTSNYRYTGVNLWWGGLLHWMPFPKGVYTVSFDIAGTITTGWTAGTRSVETSIFDTTEKVAFSSSGHYSFTFDSSAWTYDKYISISRTGNETSDVNVTISNFTIVPGSVEGMFEPYVSKTISTDWQSAIGTVYNGTVDVITGEMETDTDEFVLNGSTTISTISELTNVIRFWAYTDSRFKLPDAEYVTKIMCDRLVRTAYAVDTPSYGVADAYPSMLIIKLPIGTCEATEAGIKAYLAENPIQFVLPLANPVAHQLSAHEVATLFGNNVVWTNAGPVTVEYPVDTGLVVSHQKTAINQNEESITDIQNMIATVETTTIASKNYAIGDVFIYAGNLYKVTSSITAGGPIVLGTNCIQTTLISIIKGE